MQGPSGFDFSSCDLIANFTLGPDAGTFRGHNTVWGVSNPAWLTALTKVTGESSDHSHSERFQLSFIESSVDVVPAGQ